MNIIKTASLLLTGVILLTGCESISYTVYSDTESHTEYSVDAETLYSTLVEGLQQGSTSVVIEGTFLHETMTDVYKRIEQRYPEFFWIDSYVTIEENNRTTCNFDVFPETSAEKNSAMMTEIENAADSIISSIPDGLDDFGKILYVHDYIAENTVYATDKKSIDEIGLWDTAYGCLVQGKALCGGYSDGFSYVMKRMGIECGVVSGKVAEENGEMTGHAWNYVELNGKYYWIDLTWNDTDDEKSPVIHTYFLIDDTRMNKNRIVGKNQFFVPSCYSMEDNFFVRHNGYITVYSPDAVGEAIVSSPAAGKVEMMFADKTAYDDALKGLFEDGGLWELTEYAEISESVSYMTNDDLYVLSIQY